MLSIKYALIGKVFLIMLLSVVTGSAISQNEPTYTQYINNQLTFNPAYAGIHDVLSAQLTSRNQWVGFNGRPITNAFTIHSPIYYNEMGVGLSIVNDKLGPFNQNSIYFDYSYKITVTDKGYVSFGLKSGVDIMQFNKNDIGSIAVDDPSFIQVYENSTSLNFGVGMYYVNPDFYVGLGIPRLVKTSFNNSEQAQLETSSLHYYISAGALIDVADDIRYRPSLQARVVQNAPLLLEVMNWGIYRDTYWVGIGYRLNDSVNLGLQMQASKQIRVGYTYDYTLSDLGKYSQGTHEVSVSYDFNFNNRNKKFNPNRFSKCTYRWW